MGILRIFPHLRIFFKCFQSSAYLRISQFQAFHTLIREREMGKKNAYKITLTEPQREMRKIAHKKYP